MNDNNNNYGMFSFFILMRFRAPTAKRNMSKYTQELKWLRTCVMCTFYCVSVYVLPGYDPRSRSFASCLFVRETDLGILNTLNANTKNLDS